jgi:hypothetical protein
MRQIEFRVPPKCDLANAESLIETACTAHGLTPAMKGSLSTLKGSVHWHYKQPGQMGTLELTLLRAQRRVWAQIHTNRAAPWIDVLLPRLQKDLEKALRSAKGAARAAV